MTTDPLPQEELFAVEFVALAREIAMDIFPLADILKLHQLSDEEWQRIQANPKFQEVLQQLIAEWSATASTRERVKVKAATGLESVLEVYIRDIGDAAIPLAQRVEAGKFLARLGELDSQGIGAGTDGRFQIVFNIGEVTKHVDVGGKAIEGTVIPEL